MNNNETPDPQVRQQVSHDEISRRASELWRQYGSPQGRDEEIWLEAERQVRGTSLALDPPASEGVGVSRSRAEHRASISQEKIQAFQSEFMVPKKSRATKAGTTKGRK